MSEEEIYNSIIYLMEKNHCIIEGAGAVTVAAYMSVKIGNDRKNVCLVLSGGNMILLFFRR